MTRPVRRRRLSPDHLARLAVRAGFLLLFLYPFVPTVYTRSNFRPAPTFTSWLLPWDPLLLLGQLAHRNWTALVAGAPLLLVACALIFGRAFCGWVCPLGTVLDSIRALAFWQKLRRNAPRAAANRAADAGGNSRARYYLLLAVAAAGSLSLKYLGAFDPLVIFHRAATALMTDLLALRQPVMLVYLVVVPLALVGILLLELWHPRFWCRNLCPLGALFSIASRRSLLNRRVSEQCNGCGLCRRACAMNAIPAEAHNTDYTDCTMCLACEDACPRGGISFGFGGLAGMRWERSGTTGRAAGQRGRAAPKRRGRYVLGQEGGGRLSQQFSRRQFIGGVAAGAAGLAIAPAIQLPGQPGILRPPGALPETDFLRTCILCQECIRVCPTGGLKSTFLEGGIGSTGTPRLVPRQGSCALNPSCPNLCAQVCPVGAIQAIRPEQMKIGLARVDHTLCLAWDQGAKCLVCVEACLVEAAQAFNGRVVVDPQKCTGCGRCENACPVAGSAIRVYKVDRAQA